MPRRAASPCSHPQCPNTKPCADHPQQQRKPWQNSAPRQATAKRGYGAAWQRRRKAVLEREGNRCQSCGAGKNLTVHHADHDPHNNDTGNLVCLCRDCHERVHGRKR